MTKAQQIAFLQSATLLVNEVVKDEKVASRLTDYLDTSKEGLDAAVDWLQSSPEVQAIFEPK